MASRKANLEPMPKGQGSKEQTAPYLHDSNVCA
jgi:hypothetical protein